MKAGSKAADQEDPHLGYGPLAALLVTIGAYIASDVIAGLLLSLLPIFTGWSTTELRAWLGSSVFAQCLSIVLVVASIMGILATFLDRRKIKWSQLGLVRPQSRDVWYALIGYVLYFVAFILISQILANLISGLNLEQEQEVLFDKETTGNTLWLIFVSLVILPPIVEETLFRGFLYSGLRTRWPKLAAAIVTSILFATAHLQFGSGNALLWIAALDTFILSMILVYIREKTGSLTGPILVHFMKNGLAFVFLFLLQS